MRHFYGFTTTPFGRDLAPGMLRRHAAHGEAVARIGWCVAERRIGVITGEVDAGKTVAIRATLSTLDNPRHTIIYLPEPEGPMMAVQVPAGQLRLMLSSAATPVFFDPDSRVTCCSSCSTGSASRWWPPSATRRP